MSVRKFFVSTVAFAALTPFAAIAQSPAALPAYGPVISLELAKKMVAAAEAEATKKGWQMVIVHCLVSHPGLQKKKTKW